MNTWMEQSRISSEIKNMTNNFRDTFSKLDHSDRKSMLSHISTTIDAQLRSLRTDFPHSLDEERFKREEELRKQDRYLDEELAHLREEARLEDEQKRADARALEDEEAQYDPRPVTDYGESAEVAPQVRGIRRRIFRSLRTRPRHPRDRSPRRDRNRRGRRRRVGLRGERPHHQPVPAPVPAAPEDHSDT